VSATTERVTAARSGRNTRKTLARQAIALRSATIAAAVVAWELVARGPMRHNDFLAAPSKVVTDGLSFVLQPDTLLALWQTTFRFLIAFLIVAVAGSALGLVMGRLHRHIFLGARDVVTVLYALPMVPFYPLFVLWAGLGTRSEIAFGVIHGMIPVILMTMSASAQVEPNLISSGETMGASRFQRLLFIIVPSVLPDIVSALKIGAALTLLGVLLAELMISINGVGSFITNQITNHQAAWLNAIVLVVCLGAVVINTGLGWIERRASRWRT
jgi:NitT/TauT family transport system permease protein